MPNAIDKGVAPLFVPMPRYQLSRDSDRSFFRSNDSNLLSISKFGIKEFLSELENFLNPERNSQTVYNICASIYFFSNSCAFNFEVREV